MLVRVKNTVINTDQITTISVHEDEKYMGLVSRLIIL